jgi:FkbM family methyltransferase
MRPKPVQITHEQWDELRRNLVQHVAVSDGEFEYRFRCQTPTELWRARTLLEKEPGTVEWIRESVKPGDVVYDIGANVGMYTLMAGKRAGPSGKVYAFEPHVANVETLLFNVAANGLAAQVRVLSCGLHDQDGFIDFHYFQADGGSSMSQLGDTRDAGDRPFQPVFTEYKYATTIDLLIVKRAIEPPRHVKIDVDGNELFVLRGMSACLTSRAGPASVQVEINARHKADLFQFMEAAGYAACQRHDTQVGKKAIARGQDPEAVGYNVVFRKRPA